MATAKKKSARTAKKMTTRQMKKTRGGVRELREEKGIADRFEHLPTD
ncbi:MAG: hypothetical protein ACLQDV_15730 [Candidatus Binataceae bacterium]